MTQDDNSITTVVVKSAISLGAKTMLVFALDFYSTLKMRISPFFYWNKFTYEYPVPRVVIRQHRSLKENLGHDENYDTQDDSAHISPNSMLKGAEYTHESAEKTSANILLVDDDKDILFTFKSILDAEGYHVEAFADPNEALSHFVQMDPSYYNLVLTDIRMPKIDGFQLYEKLMEINTDIRVLFMTAFDVPGSLPDKMPNIKDSDIIRKPIEEEHFVNKIKKVINLK
jgi:CheY-like chemotaxis protein